MGLFYNRKYELYIGTPTITKKIYNRVDRPLGKDAVTGLYYSDIKDADHVKIDNLQFTCSVARLSSGKGASKDSTSFSITNMSEETREYAEREGAQILLRAGWEGDDELPLVYAGQIKTITPSSSGSDHVTNIVAGDGYIPQKNARISKFYPPSTSRADIIRDLALSMPGVSEGIIEVGELEKSYTLTGFSAFGTITEILQEFCDGLYYDYTIQNNRINVKPRFGRTEDQRYLYQYRKVDKRRYVINSAQIKRGSGKMNNNLTKLSNDEGTGAAYKFILFLDGRVQASSVVQVEDGEWQGTYQITSLRHEMNWRSGKWDTIIETQAI